MTRLCKWCNEPLPEGSHHHRKYCVGDCKSEHKEQYMREYYKRPEVKERVRKYQRKYRLLPEVKERRRGYQRKYRQRPEIRKRRNEHMRSPEVRKRIEEREAEKAEQELLATLLEMGFSDETMNEFGFERVSE